jgi:predicted metal-dependent peptidase
MIDSEPEFDALQSMFDDAKRVDSEAKAKDAMEKARTIMVMGQKPDHVFFATLVCKLKYKPCWQLDTAATDGEWMLYNPDFMLSLSKEDVRFVHAHEVMHVVYSHPSMARRNKHLDMNKLNVAMDLVVNWVLQEAKYTVPKIALMPGVGQFKDIPPNLTTLETYRLLKDKHMKGMSGSDPGGFGGIISPKGEKGSESGLASLEQDWKINVAQAANAAKLRGTLSANIDRMIGELLQAKVNWREVTREFVTRMTKQDYTWSPPNKRFIGRRLYLPRLGGEKLAGLIIANDTSGSMDMGPRSACATEIQGICEQLGCKLTILHHDSEVCAVQEWSPADGKLVLGPRGGGGTDHRPIFKWIEENIHEEISGLICLTDMMSCFPSEAPEYPVLWCSTYKGQEKSTPFGIYLEIDDNE